MSNRVPNVEVITDGGRRRYWSYDEKLRIVEESLAPGESISRVARRNGVHAAFHEFQFGDVSLNLSVVDRPSEAGFHSGFVFLHPSCKLLKLCQLAGGNPL